MLEEQKEALASELEDTRSRLQDFHEATSELEARRQDVERHQMILHQSAGLETQGLNSSNTLHSTNYTFLLVPLGIFIGAYLLRKWMMQPSM